MNIGQNCHISDKFFPKDKELDVYDSKGNKLSIGDKVAIRGCEANYGFVGFDGNEPCLYFAVNETSVKWTFSNDILARITLVK